MTGQVDADGTPAPWPARVIASLIDYLVIVAWLLVLTGLGWVIRPYMPSGGSLNLVLVDVVVLLFTVLPVWLYLTISEAAAASATLGKRVRRLIVQSNPNRAHVAAIALRNVVKLLPWQLAHLAVSRFILDEQVGLAIAFDILAIALALVTVAMAVIDPRRRALHDRVAGTVVVAIGSDRPRQS